MAAVNQVEFDALITKASAVLSMHGKDFLNVLPINQMMAFTESVNCIYQNMNTIKEETRNISADGEFVDYIIEFLEKNNKLPHVSSVEKKCNTVAERFRKDGNEHYKNNELLEALKMYTKSIAHAEKGSATLALAYANRSAVLFHKKYYAECLMDIGNAFDNNYPDSLKHKLLQRKKEASALLNQQKQVKLHEKLPEIAETNSKIQCAAGCVEIKESEYFGRHIVATRNIKVGEVVAVEKPYAVQVFERDELIHCHECVELCYNLLPCNNCKKALYCSEVCREKALLTYHKYECQIIQHNVQTYQLPLKMSLKSYQEYENTSNYVDESEQYHSDRFKEIRQFENVTKKGYLKVQLGIYAALYFYLITKCLTMNKSKALIMKELLLYNFSTKVLIAYPVYVMRNSIQRLLGDAVYSFLGLLNHSCNPNVNVINFGAYGCARARRNIKNGQQLFVNYSDSYTEKSRKARKLFLNTAYCFDCKCDACVNDWPEFPLLREDIKELDYPVFYCGSLLVKARDNYDTVNVDEIVSIVGRHLSIFEQYEPCKDLAGILSLLTKVFNVAGNRERPF